ncbi:hypothetical protein X975_13453, partial [Stegodyphus mimosarum]
MKFALACIVLLATIMVASAALTCFGDEEKCGPEECCAQILRTNIYKCKPRLGEDEICEIKPMTHILKKHAYVNRCPCSEGLKCSSSKGGVIGKFLGKC